MSFTDLPDIFGLFGIGLGIGVALITLFFIIGATVGFLFSLTNK